MRYASIRRIFVSMAAGAILLGFSTGLQQAKASKTVVFWLLSGWHSTSRTVEQKIVDQFNASQDEIDLRTNAHQVYDITDYFWPDELQGLLDQGSAPDIVGPFSLGEVNRSYADEWLNLQPLIDKTHYSLQQFPATVVNMYRRDGGLFALPFEASPGVIYYNANLFDEAGLAYPPSRFGVSYRLDGKDVEWSWDTLAEIAKRLTRDTNGNKASDANFDPTRIAQYGFAHQWDDIRANFETFGGASLVNPTTGKVQIPASWREEARWMWNGLWKDHFIPDSTTLANDSLQPSAFASSKVAMVRSMVWYTCCVSNLKARWDFAPVPMYHGATYAPADAVTFYVDKHTRNPEAAFTVLAYLVGNAAPDLLKSYELFPARPDLQPAFIETLRVKYPRVKNWDVISQSVSSIPLPYREAPYPNYVAGQDRFREFQTLLYGEEGKMMNLDQELDRLQADLQTIVDTPPNR